MRMENPPGMIDGSWNRNEDISFPPSLAGNPAGIVNSLFPAFPSGKGVCVNSR